MCVKRVDDPRDFGVAELGEDGYDQPGGRETTDPQIEHGAGWYLLYKETSVFFSCLENNIRNQVRLNTQADAEDRATGK